MKLIQNNMFEVEEMLDNKWLNVMSKWHKEEYIILEEKQECLHNFDASKKHKKKNKSKNK